MVGASRNCGIRPDFIRRFPSVTWKTKKLLKRSGRQPANFLRGVFSEPDGTPSFSRISSAIVIICAIAWVTFVVVTKFVIPELAGLAALVGSLYGANKIGNAIGGFMGKRTEQQAKYGDIVDEE